VDPPDKSYEYELTTTVTSEGETVINAFAYCGSEEYWWNLITFAWMGLLLVPGCLLSFIASRVKEDMNDTNALALVFCAHLLFLVAWVSTFAILRDTAMNEFMKYSSFLLSADTIVSLGLYFLPKFMHAGDNIEEEILPDVFVHTTLALLDVQGFTAWSSVRGKSHFVFLPISKPYTSIFLLFF
jgi:hypothetical protein